MAVRGEDDLARLATSFNAMADSLQRQITQLEGLSQLQQRFTSDVSHELRTPLTTVQMAADVLHEARGDFPPHVARSAELLQRRAGPLRGPADRPAGDQPVRRRGRRPGLRADRPRRPGRPGRRRHVRPGRAARDRAAWSTGPTRTSSPRSTRGGWSGSCGTWSATRSSTAPGHPVEITLAANRTAAAVTVRDLGVGLSSAEAQHVFDRFWRADPSRVRTVGGSGLGLSISLEDARLHGGWLQVWGQPGAGAQFRLTLPLTAGGDLTSSPLPLRPAVVRRPGTPGVSRRAGARWAALPPCCWPCPACSTVPSSSPTVQITAGAVPAGRRGRHRAAAAGAGRHARGHRPRLHRRRGQHPAGPPGGARAPRAGGRRVVVGRGRDHGASAPTTPRSPRRPARSR